MLGEFIQNNAPDVTVQIVVKSKEDWDDYIDAVSSILNLIELSFHFIYLFRFVDLTVFMKDTVPSFTRSRVT